MDKISPNTFQRLNKLLALGDLNSAQALAKSQISPSKKQAFLSIINEKKGHFLDAIKQARNAKTSAQNQDEMIIASLALMYALWRVNKFDEAFAIEESLANINAIKFQSKLLNIKGLLLWSKGRKESLQELIMQAIKCHEQNLEEKDELMNSYALNNLGNCYLSLINKEKAYQNFNQALILRQKYEYTSLIATTLRDLGRFYHVFNDYTNAQKLHRNALDLRLKLGNKFEIAKAYLSLGMSCIDFSQKRSELIAKSKNIFEELNLPEFVQMAIKSNDELKAKCQKM